MEECTGDAHATVKRKNQMLKEYSGVYNWWQSEAVEIIGWV